MIDANGQKTKSCNHRGSTCIQTGPLLPGSSELDKVLLEVVTLALTLLGVPPYALSRSVPQCQSQERPSRWRRPEERLLWSGRLPF